MCVRCLENIAHQELSLFGENIACQKINDTGLTVWVIQTKNSPCEILPNLFGIANFFKKKMILCL